MVNNDEIMQTMRYKIILRGFLDQKFSDWLEGFSITYGENVTVLTGTVMDQSGFFGLLSKLRDLNLSIVSIEQIETEY